MIYSQLVDHVVLRINEHTSTWAGRQWPTPVHKGVFLLGDSP